MNPYEEPSTPDLDDLQQNNEREAAIEVPVRVVDIGPVQVHELPARDASMRMITVVGGAPTQQIVGGNLRRKKVTVWATCSGEDNKVLYIGCDKNTVESGNAAQLPAMVNTYASGPPVPLVMSHTLPLWVSSPVGSADIQLSVVTEDWAD